MIDLKDFALAVDQYDNFVVVKHSRCSDTHPVTDLDQALDWAGNHVCGQ